MEQHPHPPQSGSHGLLYFILGAATGAGLAMLFAPAKGVDTRKEVARWLKEKRAQGHKAWQERHDHHKEVADVR